MRSTTRQATQVVYPSAESSTPSTGTAGGRLSAASSPRAPSAAQRPQSGRQPDAASIGGNGKRGSTSTLLNAPTTPKLVPPTSGGRQRLQDRPVVDVDTAIDKLYPDDHPGGGPPRPSDGAGASGTERRGKRGASGGASGGRPTRQERGAVASERPTSEVMTRARVVLAKADAADKAYAEVADRVSCHVAQASSSAGAAAAAAAARRCPLRR
jgi:hypothetical protein